jgi:Y_Y_Y domain.
LENYDDEWRNVGNQHVAFYPNLPPGEYTFKVKAANDKGVWNEKGATLKIIVNPPWWKTIWAYVIYGLLATAAVIAVDRYVRRRSCSGKEKKAVPVNWSRQKKSRKRITNWKKHMRH